MALRQKTRIHLFGNLMLSQHGKPVALAASVAPVMVLSV